jgi:hypothetical protein
MRREWGAATFVITVLIGAVAVAVSLLVNGAHGSAVAPLPPCPTYTPYPTLAAGQSPEPTPSVSPTPFNAAFANCPTPPRRPTAPPTPTPTPGATSSATPGTTPTPAPTPTGTPGPPTPTPHATPIG